MTRRASQMIVEAVSGSHSQGRRGSLFFGGGRATRNKHDHEDIKAIKLQAEIEAVRELEKEAKKQADKIRAIREQEQIKISAAKELEEWALRRKEMAEEAERARRRRDIQQRNDLWEIEKDNADKIARRATATSFQVSEGLVVSFRRGLRAHSQAPGVHVYTHLISSHRR